MLTPQYDEALPDGLYGDLDGFFHYLDTRQNILDWQMLTRKNACSDENQIKVWITSLNHQAPPATQFLPC